MKIIYIDPGLRGKYGHHANVCRDVVRELRERGLEVRIYGSIDMEEEIKNELNAIPYFTYFTYWTTDGDPICGWLNAYALTAETTKQELAELNNIGADDLVYVNSVQPAQFAAVAAWLAMFTPGQVPHTVMEFGGEPGLDISPIRGGGVEYTPRDPRIDARATLHRFASMHVVPHVRERLCLMTFERGVSAIYGALLNFPVEVFPILYRARGVVRNRVGARPITVALVGHQRVDKGYRLAPDIIRRLLRVRPDIRLLVHNSAPDDLPETQQIIRSIGASDPRVTVDERTAPEVWASLIQATDLMLCPYDPVRYHSSHSGISFESVGNGIPLVVPAGTALERWIEDFGWCGTTFGPWEPEPIVEAVAAAIDDYDRLAIAAQAAARQYAATCGPANFVDTLLAFPSR